MLAVAMLLACSQSTPPVPEPGTTLAWVPKEDITPGVVLRADHLKPLVVDDGRLATPFLVDQAALVGRYTKHPLHGGALVHEQRLFAEGTPGSIEAFVTPTTKLLTLKDVPLVTQGDWVDLVLPTEGCRLKGPQRVLSVVGDEVTLLVDRTLPELTEMQRGTVSVSIRGIVDNQPQPELCVAPTGRPSEL